MNRQPRKPPFSEISPLSSRNIVAQILVVCLLLQAIIPAGFALPVRAQRLAAGSQAIGPGAALAAKENWSIVLTPLSTEFHDHTGIDYHQPSRKLILSANAPTGDPNSFELLAGDGGHSGFSNIADLQGEVLVVAARDDGQGMSRGGFHPGTLFASTGAPGVVVRISADGASVQNPWVVLPDETKPVTGLHIDRTGVFGGDLIVVTGTGGVWRVSSSATPERLAALGTPLAGVAVVPNDPEAYGPWAGKVLVGAKEQGSVYAVDAQGQSESLQVGLDPQDIDIVPAHENFYAIDHASRKLLGAAEGAFTGIIGDILVTQESPGLISRVRWDGTGFVVAGLAEAAGLKQVAFSPAGAGQIPAVKQVYDKIAVVRHAPRLDSGRVEGTLWQLTGENTLLDGTDTITSDLLVPGTPVLTAAASASYGGTIEGNESSQPTGYTMTLAGSASLRHVVTRTDPIELQDIAFPPAPQGTRDVQLRRAGEPLGDPATLRNLEVSGNTGSVAIPPGTYGKFTISGRNTLVFGVEGSTERAVYNLEELALTGGSQLLLAGPVKLRVRNSVTLVGSAVGAADNPKLLLLEVADGLPDEAVTVGGTGVLYAIVRAPQGTISIEGSGRLRGTVACDVLHVDGNGVLQITENDIPPPPVNRPPTADAGPDHTITLPTDTVTLEGTATDDGLPAGSTLAFTWTKVSGPGEVTFADAVSAATSATFSAEGEYVLKLTASDGQLSSSDTTTVTVIPRNHPPVVDAGQDQTIKLPASAGLRGTVTDDGLPRGSSVTATWSMVSGPGAVVFADPNAAVTTASFSVSGVYILRLSASDTELTASDDVVITVSKNDPPVVDAGPDQTVILSSGTTQEPPFIQLVRIQTGFSSPIGIDYHQPTNKLVMSVNYSNGQPYNFELVAADGSRQRFSNVSGLTDELKIGVVPDEGGGLNRGGFAAGTLFSGTGAAGQILRVSPDGTVVDRPWITLPGETGLMRGSLYVDRTGVFGGDLIVVTTAGGVWRVKANGAATRLALINTHLEGAVTVPNDPLRYGPWAGKILIGAEDQARLYTVDPQGAVAFYQLGIQPEDIEIIPPNQNFFGVDYGGSTLWGIPAASFAGMTGDILIAQESPGILWWVRWNGSKFDVSKVAQVSQWEHVTFAPSGILAVASTSGTATLQGTATDDGLPSGQLTTSWEKASGPGSVSFAQPTQLTTAATFSQPGEYTLRLTASDSALSASDLTKVTLTGNRPPVVDAGPDQVVATDGLAILPGTVTDDGLPFGKLSSFWMKVLGPGAVSFAAPTFDPAAELSTDLNPSGRWTFGSTPATGGSFTPFTIAGATSGLPGWFSADPRSTTPPGYSPFVVANKTANVVAFAGNEQVPGSTLVITPGSNGRRGVVRWTAPASGAYLVQGVFQGMSSATSSDVAVAVNGSDVLRRNIGAAPDAAPFSFVRTLATGDSIDFSVGYAGRLDADETFLTLRITAAGPAATQATFSSPGTYLLRLVGSDGQRTAVDDVTLNITGNSSPDLVGATLSLAAGNTGPYVTGTLQPLLATLRNSAGDPLANYGVEFEVSGANATTGSAVTDDSGVATFRYSGTSPGTDSVRAVVRETSTSAIDSNIVSMSWSLTPASPPVVQGWIGGPINGSTVTGIVPITVGADVTLTQGTVEYWPAANPSAVTVLATGVQGGPGATFAVFDTTLLANGNYIIRLRATDSNGQELISQVMITVTGENKPGRVTFSVTDLTVPVTGIPITIERHYDSLERNQIGDFGYGWSLEMAGPRLEVSPDYDVTITEPGTGRRVTFQFAPTSLGFPFSFLYQPTYAPEPGVYGKLASDGCGLLIRSSGGVACYLSSDPTYHPTVYTYTDPYGRVYTMTAAGKMQSIQDLNGNVLTFSATGISSSSGGLNVPFVRDAQGRITQITDPNGKTFRYNYDAAGDLVGVQLPDTETPLRYEYASGHFFLKGTDARGNTEATTTYYADGRLQSVTDAIGKTTGYTYDLATNTTTVTHPDNTGTTIERYDAHGMVLSTTDPLGRTTSYTYDANHNKRTEIDALGKTTTYDYDANGHLKSVTDPLNKTRLFTNNEFGQPVTATDQLGKIRTLKYDANQNLSSVSDELSTRMAFTWNERGNPLTFTDANGKVAHFTFDAYGNILSRTDPLGRTTSYTYDTMGRALTMTDARGVTRFSYDALGRMLSVIDPLSNETRYEYDANGNRTAVIDAKGRTTRTEYDPANRVSKTTYPDGMIQSYTYNFRGQKETETVAGTDAATGPFSRTTTYRYDNAGQLVKIIHPDLSEVKLAYDEVGRTKTATDELNKTFTYQYDPGCGCSDRLAKIIDPNGNSITYTYDAAGRRISFTDAANRETRYTYDVRNRLTKTTFADNTFAEATFDGMGRLLTSTDQEGRVTRFAHDDVGNLLSVTDAQGATTQYAYDALNNLLSSRDANSRTTRFEYDVLNRLIKRVLPLGMAELYTYDQVGNLATRTDFKGKQTSYEYDSMNRLTAQRPDASLGEPAVLYSYTGTGMRRSMTDASGTTTYTYDQRDRLITKQTPQGTLTYGYDLAGDLISMRSSNADGVSVDYTYDNVYRLENVIDNQLAAGTTTYTYDVVGNLKSDSLPNGVLADYTYDVLNRLTHLGVTREGTTQAGYAYNLDRTGRRLSVTENGGRTVNYTYDAVYRLTREAVTGSQNSAGNGAVDYTYDPVGNRLSRLSSLEGVLSSTSTYDANDRLLSDSYDANGNTTSADGRTYVYDFENRVKSANGGAVRITYDGDGNLAAKTVGGVTTRYLVDDLNPTGYSQVVEEIVNGEVQKQYTYGHTIVSQKWRLSNGWAVSFYSMDGHGSVRQLTDQAGAVTDTYTYDAFGKLISRTGTTPNPYLYAGERYDTDLGLYYLRARHYNADRGRFVSMDPYPGEIDDPVSLHKYLYVNADPVNFIDPLGLSATEEGIFSKLATRWAPAAYIVGRQIACVLITNASVIAATLGYDEWLDVAQLAETLALIPCLRYPTPKPVRRIPNPHGSLGGPAHRDKVQQVANELERRGFKITGGGGRMPEERLPVPGRRAGRRPDITAEKDGRTVRVQVGKQTKGGGPVARERDALGDIRSVQEPGDHTIFIPYK